MREECAGKEHALTNAPLADSHGLATIDEDLTGPATGEADEAIGRVSLKPSGVNRHHSFDERRQRRAPPLARESGSEVDVIGPTIVRGGNPPVDPEVTRPQ